MKRVLSAVILIGFCVGQNAIKNINLYENSISFNSKKMLVQVGHINEFVLDQGHPFRKPSVFGFAIIQQGKLREFVLDQGYPSKIKPDQTISNFKIIGEY